MYGQTMYFRLLYSLKIRKQRGELLFKFFSPIFTNAICCYMRKYKRSGK